MVDKSTFSGIVSQIIDNLEGGYYHPQMLADGRVKDSRYGTSGETMFGIDRRQGGDINTSPEGKKFWSIIDGAGAKNAWKWNYKGGSYGSQLKDLAAAMMYPKFADYSNRYLTPDTNAIVQSDPRLLFHFGYATWNGPGWFKKFANDMNKAVASGIKNPDQLAQVAIKSRTAEGYTPGSAPNSLIAQGGNKIASLFGSLRSTATAAAKAGYGVAKSHPFVTISIAAGFVIAGYIIYKQITKK